LYVEYATLAGVDYVSPNEAESMKVSTVIEIFLIGFLCVPLFEVLDCLYERYFSVSEYNKPKETLEVTIQNIKLNGINLEPQAPNSTV